MTSNELANSLMWDAASSDQDAIDRRKLVVRAKVGLSGAMPFLQAAGSVDEFDHRLALLSDQLQDIPAEVLGEVVASLKDDWQIVATARAEHEGLARQAALQRVEAHVAPPAPLPSVEVGEQFFHAASGKWITVRGRAPFVERSAAYVPDPDMQWRYHSYPPSQPVPGQGGQPTTTGEEGVAHPMPGSSIETPDGFPLDVAQGEQRSGDAYAFQLMPGNWTVTPGSEWPQVPNAGSPDPTPVYAHRVMAAGTCPNCLSNNVSVGGPSGQGDEETCKECGHVVSHPSGRHRPDPDAKGRHSASMAERAHNLTRRVLASEGIVPTPGPNPNYFSQGTTGLQGPPEFPPDPEAGIEPKTDNNMDTLYGAVPPVQSSGSSEGPLDGQGYSRQGVPGPSGFSGSAGERTASTDGKIVGICDHCGKSVRHHTDMGGHLRHLHSDSADCADGHRATASFFNVIVPSPPSRDAGGFPVQYSGQFPVERENPSTYPYAARSATGAVSLEAPTPENPTGRGRDDFSAKTFDSLIKQRPLQSPEDRNANTPTVSQSPIQVGNANTPQPGSPLDQDGPRERSDNDREDDEDD